MTLTLRPSISGSSSDIGASAAPACSTVAGIGDVNLHANAADLVLELVGGAVRDHAAGVDHGDPVGEPVGLVEVLGGQQHGRALADQALDGLPEVEPAARVEARGRLVEEDHRRSGDERRGEVEAARMPPE